MRARSLSLLAITPGPPTPATRGAAAPVANPFTPASDRLLAVINLIVTVPPGSPPNLNLIDERGQLMENESVTRMNQHRAERTITPDGGRTHHA